ncbi:hypothetical protein Bca4012_036809 [Brassica carinata]
MKEPHVTPDESRRDTTTHRKTLQHTTSKLCLYDPRYIALGSESSRNAPDQRPEQGNGSSGGVGKQRRKQRRRKGGLQRPDAPGCADQRRSRSEWTSVVFRG